jgi:hypothetical protein
LLQHKVIVSMHENIKSTGFGSWILFKSNFWHTGWYAA